MYAYTTILWRPNKSKIDNTIRELNGLDFDLACEGDVDSFLRIQIDTEDYGTITMSSCREYSKY